MFCEAHAFLSGIDRAIQKAVGHVVRCVERYQPKAVVLESLPENGRASPVGLQVRDSLRRLAVPIFEVSEQELLRSFALPTLKKSPGSAQRPTIDLSPPSEQPVHAFMSRCGGAWAAF